MKTDERTLPSHNQIDPKATSAARMDKLLSFGALFVCCAVLAALRCRFLFTGNGGNACVWVTAGSVVVMFLLSLRSRMTFKPVLQYGKLSVTFGASVAACLLLTSTCISVYYNHFAAAPVIDGNFAVSFLAKLFGVTSAVSFVIASAAPALEKKKTLHLMLSISPIVYCAMRVLNTFINSSTLPVAVTGGYRVIGLIAAMLFFLNEGKLLLGVKTSTAYQFTGYTAAIFCAAYDVPLLVYGLRNGGFDMSTAYTLLTIGLVAYILTRIATLPARTKQ